MIRHFESLWEEAEKLQDTELSESMVAIQTNLSLLDTCPPEMREYHMGLVIYNLCNVSKCANVNTYLALQKTIVDKKSEILDKSR